MISSVPTTDETSACADLPPVPSAHDDAAANLFLDQLYADRNKYLERDRYSSIGEADAFFTKVVGVTFDGRQDIVAGMIEGTILDLRRDPENPHDPSAIGVWYGALQLGFLRRPIAFRLSPNIDAGAQYRAVVGSITGGGTRAYGLNIYVTRERPKRDLTQRTTKSSYTREQILQALLGDRPLRDSQLDVLKRVDAGQNTLAVLGTGRGKSVCFQYPAAVRALESAQKTIVLYPLRALANDQFDALVRRLEPLGLRIMRANGSISSVERDELFEALAEGTWDIICSTPEFFIYHLGRFEGSSSPALVVIDEAHHLIASRHRPAYKQVASAIETLGAPQVLALTATAGDDTFESLRSALNINSWVIDPTVRANLHMVDARGTTHKRDYIRRTIENAHGKSIIYCNSRSEATKVAEWLRGTIASVAFYHAGVPTAERSEIERLFRTDALRVVVATSAFGEGIDLPDVRHVFLYHLNFNLTEFNQQSGRAGRDGEPAQIHLLFNERDRGLNEYILEQMAPTLYTLRVLYKSLVTIAPTDGIRQSFAELADLLCLDKVSAGTVGTAIRIFAECGLVEIGEDDDGRFIRFVSNPPHVDMTKNARFAEGEAERELFSEFCELILQADASVLENIVNRPIYPTSGRLLR